MTATMHECEIAWCHETEVSDIPNLGLICRKHFKQYFVQVDMEHGMGNGMGKMKEDPKQVMNDAAERIAFDVERGVGVSQADLERFTTAQAIVHNNERIAREEGAKAMAELFKLFGIGGK